MADSGVRWGGTAGRFVKKGWTCRCVYVVLAAGKGARVPVRAVKPQQQFRYLGIARWARMSAYLGTEGIWGSACAARSCSRKGSTWLGAPLLSALFSSAFFQASFFYLSLR